MKDLHQDWRGRKQAIAEMASERGKQRAVTAAELVELIGQESLDLGVLNGSLQTLVALGSAALPRLQPLLEHSLSEVRQAAAVVLGQLDPPLGVPLLLQLLSDGDTNVRYHAVEALGQQQSLAAVERLTEMARGKDDFLAFAALEALAQIADPAVLPDLCLLLSHPMLGGSAAETLGRIGHPAALPCLLKQLAAEDEVAIAIESLVRANASLAVAPSPWLRGPFALERAGQSFPDEAMLEILKVGARPETVQRALSSQDPEVRLEAALNLRDQPCLLALLPEFPERVAPALDHPEALAAQLEHVNARTRLLLIQYGLRAETPVAVLRGLLDGPARAAAGRWLAAADALPDGWLEREPDGRVRCEVLEEVRSLPVLLAFLGHEAEGLVVLRRLAEWPAQPDLDLPERDDLWWNVFLCRLLGQWRLRSELLEARLDDLRPPVRAEAAKALALADPQRAVRCLPALLLDSELDVAEAAVQALASAGCWEPVRGALDEPRLRDFALTRLAGSSHRTDLEDLPAQALLESGNALAYDILLERIEQLSREQCERFREIVLQGWRPSRLPARGRRWLPLIFRDVPEVLRELWGDADAWVRRGALVADATLRTFAAEDSDATIRSFA